MARRPPTFGPVFSRLRQKWGVSTGRLFLILLTFALGGSLCGQAGRWLLHKLDVAAPVLWWPLYILLVTLLWPLSVLLVSIPLGQFAFFGGYLRRMWNRLRRRR